MNNGILSKEDILCMQYSRMKSSQIMNPNLAPEEFPTPPNEACCWPGRRGGEAGRGAVAKLLMAGALMRVVGVFLAEMQLAVRTAA